MTAIRLERTLTPFARRHAWHRYARTSFRPLRADAKDVSTVSTRDYLCSNCRFYRRIAIGFERRALHRRCVVGEPGKQQCLLRKHGTSSGYDQAEIGDEPVVGAQYRHA